MAGRVATEVTRSHSHEFLFVGAIESYRISGEYYCWISITWRKELKKFASRTCVVTCSLWLVVPRLLWLAGRIYGTYIVTFLLQSNWNLCYRLYGNFCLTLYLYSYITLLLHSTGILWNKKKIERRRKKREEEKERKRKTGKKNNKSLDQSIAIKYGSA